MVVKNKQKHNKFQRIITFPIRALAKARDSYVKGLSSFGERGSFGGFNGALPASHSSNLPKSYNVSVSSSWGSNSESEDMRELVRAASVRRLGGRLTDELSRRPAAPPAPATGVVPRSCSVSVGMGKIDENSTCEFEEEDVGFGFNRGEAMYPRSKSYVPVAKRSHVVF